jgi:23S rRNA (uracil1939-C5)-methyltransferase
MPLAPGNRVELEIGSPVAGGRMLARHEGQVVLVAGAIPGERVRAIVERGNKQVAWARVDVVHTPSPDRRHDSRDPACGGLAYVHIQLERQRDLKADVIVDAFRRIGRMPLDRSPAVASSPESGYRLRARLHVRERRAGFFREGTHDLCDAAATGQLHAEATEAVQSLIAALGDFASRCDSIIVAENVGATERVLHLVPADGVDGSTFPASLEAIANVSGITSADPFGQPLLLAGAPTLSETAASLLPTAGLPGTAMWRRHATSFFQANRFLTGALAQRVLDLADGARVADLYSGIGLFAVGLAARGARVLAVEGDESSSRDLVENAAEWPGIDVFRGAVEEAMANTPREPADVIVVDPPRTGLSPAAITAIVRWTAPRIVYVSCDPPTLARDARRLAEAGYVLTSIEAFDFFPNTPHVETLAVFDAARL